MLGARPKKAARTTKTAAAASKAGSLAGRGAQKTAGSLPSMGPWQQVVSNVEADAGGEGASEDVGEGQHIDDHGEKTAEAFDQQGFTPTITRKRRADSGEPLFQGLDEDFEDY